MALTPWSGGVAALGAAALFVLGDVAGAAAQTVVKLAHAVSTQDPYQYGSERFKELVEKGTGGRLQVQLFPAGQLGNEREIIEGVKLGTIEVGLVASAPPAGSRPPFCSSTCRSCSTTPRMHVACWTGRWATKSRARWSRLGSRCWPTTSPGFG